MDTCYSRETLGNLVTQNFVRSQVFEKLGLDYCCGGTRLLEEACHEKSLDVAAVVHALELCDVSEAKTLATDWATAPLSQLVNHIVQEHHAYLREELPPLAQLVAKVAVAHGKAHSELYELQTVFLRFKTELHSHLIQEETLLFPLIQGLDSAPSSRVAMLLPLMQTLHKEHDMVGRSLTMMRQITKDYSAPDTACNSYRALMIRLLRLEKDLHQHVHKENNILFPRVQRRVQQERTLLA